MTFTIYYKIIVILHFYFLKIVKLIKPLLKYYLFIFVFLLCISNIFAQADLGELFERNNLDNNDTLKIRRTFGTWWVGLTAGGNLQKYYGSIYMPQDPNRLTDPLKNPEYQLSGGMGGGVQDYGIFTEYQPAGGEWGISLRSYISNLRTVSASSDKIDLVNSFGNTSPNTFQTTNPQSKSSIDYYSFYPSLRLNLYQNFYFLMGIDINFLKSSFIHHIRYQNNPDPIIDTRKFDLTPIKTRFGAYFGVGYDLFVLDYNKGNRVVLAPYATIGTGTAMFNKNADGISNPTLSSIDFKFGLSVKFSQDKEYLDTLKYNPEAKEKLDVLASAQIDRGVNYSGFTKQELTQSSEIEYRAIPEIVEQIKEEPVFSKEMAEQKKDEPQVEKVKVVPDEDLLKLKKFFYSTESATGMPSGMKEYLNSVALYLIAHPKASVIIDGHSDNRGTPDELQKRSDDRAKIGLKYLQSKSIKLTQIFIRGFGARKPLDDNNSEDGRRKNRRVEITVKP